VYSHNYPFQAGDDKSGPRGYVKYRCAHDGLYFDGYNAPLLCKCGAPADRIWMIIFCDGCKKDLYYPRGRVLRSKCDGSGKGHKPIPDSDDGPPVK
jgi:hypothetical protein